MSDSRRPIILNVDDNEAGRYATSRMLRAAGFEVWEAARGVEALKKALEGPDLVVLDVNLPDLSGFEVCRRLKSDPPTCRLPVLHLSATFVGAADRAAGLDGGADGYLTQPVDADELNAAVRALLRLKESEKQLRESEQRFRRIYEESPVAYLSQDAEGRILDVNPAWLTLLGYTREEVVGRRLDEFLMPASQAAFAERFPRFRECGSMHGIEIELQCKDGEILTLAFDGDFSRDAQGQPAYTHSVLHNITERRRAEAERERLAKAIEQAAEIVIVTDSQGTIQYVNPAFEDVTGYTRMEALGRNPRMLKSGNQDEAFYRNLWDTISGGQIWKGQMVNKRKDGTFFTEESTISPVTDAGGQITNFVAVKRDITEQLRLGEEKARLEKQLQQLQKLDSIGRLAGGVAHDFNNMLCIILGYGDILLHHLHSDDPLSDYVKQIVEAGKRSAELTRQLLAFSRKQTLQPQVLNLNDLVGNLEKMLRRLIGEDIELNLALAQDVGRVLVDPGQLEHAIMNLVVNARDAMPTGGKLLIETAAVELDQTYAEKHAGVSPGQYVLLAVTDTGCGMPQEVLSKVFEPFFTTKEVGKGTGLGLASVYGIVKQSGGNIWVYSEPGRGTTFKIYLPQTESKQEPAKKIAEDASRTGLGEHILVVEDEESLRKFFGSILPSLGYRVTLAANGGEALLLIEEKGLRPDLIITDVIMPNMSGKVLVNRLRKICPDLKVIFMSGYTDNAIVHHGILDPGTPFIQKPSTIRDITGMIQHVLRGNWKPVPLE